MLTWVESLVTWDLQMLDLYIVGMNASPNYIENKTFEKVVEEIMIAVFVPIFLIVVLE